MTKKKPPHILVVDDEVFNLKIIEEYLSYENYRISTAENGLIAWNMLTADPYDYDIILLDRMMPEMNGMEVLRKIKTHPVLQYCPVIFQTAKISKNNILEGLNAGALYYLTKPFEEDMLLSVIKTACRDRAQQNQLLGELEKAQNATNLMQTAYFKFQTLNDVHSLSSLLSYAYPEPKKIIMGLYELLINAVEHGNLGITYDEKSELNKLGRWEEEISQRLLITENKEKFATLEFEKNETEIVVTISDLGDGFNCSSYMDFDPLRIMDNHGRGIAMANKLSFSSIEFNEAGNVVHGHFILPNSNIEESEDETITN